MPKSRDITRANRKLGKEQECTMNIRNAAGYNDPTPYFAFKNMEREEKSRRNHHCDTISCQTINRQWA